MQTITIENNFWRLDDSWAWLEITVGIRDSRCRKVWVNTGTGPYSDTRYSDKCFWKGATNTNSNPNLNPNPIPNPNPNSNPNSNPNPNPLHYPFRNVRIGSVGIRTALAPYYVDASAVVTDVGLFCRVRLGIWLYKGLYACLFPFCQ